MASQTGTLKFRQSDGTYTELYPKTTIAQVDGLQTQLDSINTSLQNKVELNRTYTNDSGSITLLTHSYGLICVQKDNLAQLLLECTATGLSIIATNVPWNKSIQLILQIPDDIFPQGRCYLYGKNNNGATFSQNLATEDYVQQQIQGTINASY